MSPPLAAARSVGAVPPRCDIWRATHRGKTAPTTLQTYFSFNLTAAITDTRAIAHDMQANAKRGLLWGIVISVLFHLTVLTVQVGGDSFGWRAPTSEAQQDVSTRMKARLVPRETPATPLPEASPRPIPTEQRPSEAPKTTTVTVNASAFIPRAEVLDPPIPRVEQPAALPPSPIKPPTPTVEIKPDNPAPSAQPPELVTPAKTEPKAPAPLAATPPPLPVTPPALNEPAPPKPEMKEVVESPAAKKEPAAPTPPPVAAEPAKAAPSAPVAVPTAVGPPVPVVAPVPSPTGAAPTPPVAAPTPVPAPVTPTAVAAPAAPAASAQPVAVPVATPVLAQSAPSAAAAAPAAASASPASAAPSGSSAPASAASTSAPASGSTGSPGVTARPTATVTLPSPRLGEAVPAGTPGATGSERFPAFNMPPAKPEGFDPYKARSDAAREAARELNSRRSLVPPSVAPSLTERERMARDVESAIREECRDLGNRVGLLALPSVVSGVLFDSGCKIRK